MLRLKLNHVSKRGPRNLRIHCNWNHIKLSVYWMWCKMAYNIGTFSGRYLLHNSWHAVWEKSIWSYFTYYCIIVSVIIFYIHLFRQPWIIASRVWYPHVYFINVEYHQTQSIFLQSLLITSHPIKWSLIKKQFSGDRQSCWHHYHFSQLFCTKEIAVCRSPCGIDYISIEIKTSICNYIYTRCNCHQCLYPSKVNHGFVI